MFQHVKKKENHHILTKVIHGQQNVITPNKIFENDEISRIGLKKKYIYMFFSLHT